MKPRVNLHIAGIMRGVQNAVNIHNRNRYGN